MCIRSLSLDPASAVEYPGGTLVSGNTTDRSVSIFFPCPSTREDVNATLLELLKLFYGVYPGTTNEVVFLARNLSPYSLKRIWANEVSYLFSNYQMNPTQELAQHCEAYLPVFKLMFQQVYSMHVRNLVHGDIKPEIFNCDGYIFSFIHTKKCQDLAPCETQVKAHWPEEMMALYNRLTRYDAFKADIYMLANTCFRLIAGYDFASDRGVRDDPNEFDPNRIPDAFRKFAPLLWEMRDPDPQKRPTIGQCLDYLGIPKPTS